jgi:hypothetical protein
MVKITTKKNSADMEVRNSKGASQAATVEIKLELFLLNYEQPLDDTPQNFWKERKLPEFMLCW